ncbi:MAG: hypothetical protein WB682_01915 [Candidatus Dormiibacterota bacterium]
MAGGDRESDNRASKRPDPHRRRNLRIAIRQLERAELYLVALYSLDLAEEGVEGSVDDLIRDLRGLRQHLVRVKLKA